MEATTLKVRVNPFEHLRFDPEAIITRMQKVVRDAGLGPDHRVRIFDSRQHNNTIWAYLTRHTCEMWTYGYIAAYTIGWRSHSLELLPKVENGLFRTVETAQLHMIGTLMVRFSEIGDDIDDYDELMQGLNAVVRRIRERQVEHGDTAM